MARDGTIEKENKMAWKDVPGSNGIWQYDDEATSDGVYGSNTIYISTASGSDSNGIRTFTWPNGKVEQIYIKCKKTGETIEQWGSGHARGELSKTYYDAQ